MNAISDILTPLGLVPVGCKAKVISFDPEANEETVSRLREIGFSEGLEVELLHTSLFKGGPIAIRVDKTTVALRRSEANMVKVQSV